MLMKDPSWDPNLGDLTEVRQIGRQFVIQIRPNARRQDPMTQSLFLKKITESEIKPNYYRGKTKYLVS
jgi:hypothetical protein